MLGKRKRSTIVARRLEMPEEMAVENGNHDLLKKYFESKFEPLENSTAPTSEPPDRALEDEDSEMSSDSSSWGGISDGGETAPVVEVIEHSSHINDTVSDTRSPDFRSFMSSKVPREARVMMSKTSTRDAADEDGTETLNLKHDLDLQRLLKESHLLEKSKSSKTSDEQRHRATDMRLQSLGSQNSLFDQPKMPLSHRRGIQAKAASREQLRRKDAKENGIVLEKPTRSDKAVITKRDRGVDGPSIGRFQHGALKLTRKDVASIQGVPRGLGKRGRR